MYTEQHEKSMLIQTQCIKELYRPSMTQNTKGIVWTDEIVMEILNKVVKLELDIKG